MAEITYGSLFSGIGGIDAGLDAAGMRCLWQCETDPDAVRVLERHWPAARRYSDVKEIDAARLDPVDLVCGGPPCQDWSVAGKRAGISGARGGLFFDFVRVVDAVAPRWVLVENVPGLLHAGKPRGEDFATVLEHLTGFRPAVPEGGWRSAGVCSGHKRHLCWRVLDARFFGVAQRRRRVFFVASAPDAGCVPVLFEPPGGGGHPAPGREAGADLAPAVTPGARRASGARAGEQLTVAGTVNADPGRKGWAGDDTHLIASPVMAHGGIHERQQTFVTHAPTSGGADASEDGTGRGTPLVIDRGANKGMTGGTFISEDICPAQVTAEPHAVAYQCQGSDVAPMGTARAGNGGLKGGVPFVAGEPLAFNWQSGGSKDFVGPKEGHADALGTSQTPAVAFTVNAHNSCAKESHAREADAARRLDGAGGYAPGQGGTLIGFDLSQITSGVNRSNPRPGDPQPPLCAAGQPMVAGALGNDKRGGGWRCGPDEAAAGQAIISGMMVRRLTPTECARLQAFPDDWLDLDPPLSDSVKYRLLGNAVCVAVSRWLGRRIALVLREDAPGA